MFSSAPRVEKIPVMNAWQRLTFAVLSTGALALVAIFAIYWFNPQHLPSNFSGLASVIDVFIFLLVTYVVWHQVLSDLNAMVIMAKMRRPKYMAPAPNRKVAFISTFVPGKEPYSMLEANIRSMVAADYPHDTWILDEGNDPRAKDLCEAYGAKHFSRHGIEKYNQPDGRYATKTKGGNHNAWYNAVGKNYDIVAQIDLDFIASKHFLTRTLGYFNDQDVGFVGTPQVYGNGRESAIAQGAAEQSFSFYGAMEKGLFGNDVPFMVGANHVIRVEALKDIGYYAGHLTEDMLTSMQLYARNWKGVYVPEVLAVGEGPTTWQSFFNQQMRWAHGCIDILFRHSFKLYATMHPRQALIYFTMQQHYFSGLTFVLGQLLTAAYFLFGVNATNMDMTAIILYLALTTWQLLIATWLQRFYIRPWHESGLLLKGKMVMTAALPIFFMASINAVRGKHLGFKVTTKGEGTSVTPMKLFVPHIIMGTVSLVSLLIGIALNHTSPLMIFWAASATLLMYGVSAPVVVENLRAKLQQRRNSVELSNS